MFQCGDVVELNSGGPPMVVIGMRNSPLEGMSVLAEWDDAGEKTANWFPCESVHRIGVEQISIN